ncbi:hypothetical protein C8R45DRAFT_994987 [Mycena sanguinolenta]|nr:hypothetical protein C8R45DRAFT_994987 [Mycena sanguinolenta]
MCLQAPSLFLALPAELRLQIYDGVVHLLVDCQVGWYPSSQPEPALSMPWLNLMLVCKTITEELRRHLHTGNTIYELDMHNLEKKHRTIADEVTWRRIPCPPGSVRTLQANLFLHFQTHLWGDGGPHAILSQLYQVLNRFVHNGPLLARRSPLVNHIHLSTLIGMRILFSKYRNIHDITSASLRNGP